MTQPLEQATREKRLAALASVGSAVVLVGLKIFLSVITGSLGILSEALHSGLDLVAAIVTFLSVRMSDQPAEATYLVVRNDEEQYSVWNAERPLPPGWHPAGVQGTRTQCLEHIAEVWTDMRPKSLRDAMTAG